MPASSTALVSSSTNRGLPSVLTTICSVTSEGSGRPPVTRATMLSTLERSRRPSVKALTLGRPIQAGSNPVVCPEPGGSLQLGDERTKRAVDGGGRALETQARVRLAGDALGESRRKAGLADPRLARNQHDLPFAPPGAALALQQEIELVLAAD